MPSPPKYPTPSLLVPAALPPSGRRGIPKKRCGNPRRRAGKNVKPRRPSNPWIALTGCGRGRRLLNNPKCDLAFHPPIKFKGDSFTGTVTSIQNSRLRTIYERVGASGKVTASVRETMFRWILADAFPTSRAEVRRMFQAKNHIPNSRKPEGLSKRWINFDQSVTMRAS